MLNNLIYLEVPRPTGYAHHTLKSSGLSLVPKAFGTSSCINRIFNPKQISTANIKKLILLRNTVPYNTKGCDCKSHPASATFISLNGISARTGAFDAYISVPHLTVELIPTLGSKLTPFRLICAPI